MVMDDLTAALIVATMITIVVGFLLWAEGRNR